MQTQIAELRVNPRFFLPEEVNLFAKRCARFGKLVYTDSTPASNIAGDAKAPIPGASLWR